MEPNFPTMIL